MWQKKWEIFARVLSRLYTLISKTERKQRDGNKITRITTTKADLNCFGLLDNMFGHRIGMIYLVICSNDSCGCWKSPELVLPSAKSISVPFLMPLLPSSACYTTNKRLQLPCSPLCNCDKLLLCQQPGGSNFMVAFLPKVWMQTEKKKKCPWWYALLWSSYSKGVSQKCLVQKCLLMSLRCLYIQQL